MKRVFYLLLFSMTFAHFVQAYLQGTSFKIYPGAANVETKNSTYSSGAIVTPNNPLNRMVLLKNMETVNTFRIGNAVAGYVVDPGESVILHTTGAVRVFNSVTTTIAWVREYD